MCSPDRLEDRPLFGMLLDVPLEDRRESANAGADVGIAVAGRDELERLFDPREEETLLAPGECRKERGACPQRERDLGRREQSGASEELDRFTDPRDARSARIPRTPASRMTRWSPSAESIGTRTRPCACRARFTACMNSESVFSAGRVSVKPRVMRICPTSATGPR